MDPTDQRRLWFDKADGVSCCTPKRDSGSLARMQDSLAFFQFPEAHWHVCTHIKGGLESGLPCPNPTSVSINS